MRRSLVFASALLACALVAVACETSRSDQLCHGVPDGGCPLSHGTACDDPACAAAYACNPDGTWTLDHVCPARDAAAPADAGEVDAGDAASDGQSARGRDAAIDAPPGAYGGPGCGALEAPDCPLGVAVDCPNGCCDCVDLFVCADGGWDLWGACGDAGVVPRR